MIVNKDNLEIKKNEKELLKQLNESEKDVKNGKVKPFEDVYTELRKKLLSEVNN